MKTIQKQISIFDGVERLNKDGTFLLQIPEKMNNRRFDKLVPVFRAEGPYNQRLSPTRSLLLHNKSALVKPGYFNETSALWVSIGNPIRTIDLALVRRGQRIETFKKQLKNREISKAQEEQLIKDENNGKGTVIRTTFITRELANEILRAGVSDKKYGINVTGVLSSDINHGFNQVGLGNRMLAKFKKQSDNNGVYDGMYFKKPKPNQKQKIQNY